MGNRLKAQFVYENINFERGKDPMDAMKIGRESRIQKEFGTYFDAADWAVRNLELITDGKYSPNDIIRKKGAEVMPRDLVEYIERWVKKVKLTGYSEGPEDRLMQDLGLLREVGNQLKKHGILVENIEFEKGKDPKEAMGLGTVRVNGDRGYGEYNVRLLDRYHGSDLLDDEEVWKAKDIDSGNIVYVVKHSDFKSKRKGVWGEIDPFIMESMEFERGKSIKRTMGIGERSIIMEKFKKIIDENPQWLDSIQYEEGPLSNFQDTNYGITSILSFDGKASDMKVRTNRIIKENDLKKYLNTPGRMIRGGGGKTIQYQIKDGFQDIFRGINISKWGNHTRDYES